MLFWEAGTNIPAEEQAFEESLRQAHQSRNDFRRSTGNRSGNAVTDRACIGTG
jgi:hypothetical protein